MTRFEPGSTDVGSSRSVKRASTTAPKLKKTLNNSYTTNIKLKSFTNRCAEGWGFTSRWQLDMNYIKERPGKAQIEQYFNFCFSASPFYSSLHTCRLLKFNSISLFISRDPQTLLVFISQAHTYSQTSQSQDHSFISHTPSLFLSLISCHTVLSISFQQNYSLTQATNAQGQTHTLHTFTRYLPTSVARWLYYFQIFGHWKQWKFAQQHNKFTKVCGNILRNTK